MSDLSSPGTAIPAKRPGLVSASGIISIVFCSLGLLFSLWGALAMLIFGGPEQMMQMFRGLYGPSSVGLYDAMMEITVKHYPVTLTFNMVYIFVLLAGLFGGIFLLSAKKRGILLLRIYGIAALVILAFQLVWTLQYVGEVGEVMKNYFSSSGLPRNARGFTAGIMDFAMYFGTILGVMFWASWPILILIFTSRKKVNEYIQKAKV
jgi:hypothetical protein